MKELVDIKYWIFDLDNTLYSGQTKVFSEVDKKMSSFISKKFDVDLVSAREIPAVFSYFSSYQYFREKNMSIFLSGSLAGTISWFITYPVDTIKTRLQNNSCKTIKEAIKKGNLFTGLNLCLIRAFIVNGVNFSVYEFVMKELNKK